MTHTGSYTTSSSAGAWILWLGQHPGHTPIVLRDDIGAAWHVRLDAYTTPDGIVVEVTPTAPAADPRAD